MFAGGVCAVNPVAQSFLPKFVTLNLFQGPSGRKPGASRTGTGPTGLLATARSGWEAKWALKQVQGDGVFFKQSGGKFNHSERGEQRPIGESRR